MEKEELVIISQQLKRIADALEDIKDKMLFGRTVRRKKS